MGSCGLDDQRAAVLVEQARPGLETARVVGDPDDVDLAAEAVRLADLPGE
jgi:hypothetical protein